MGRIPFHVMPPLFLYFPNINIECSECIICFAMWSFNFAINNHAILSLYRFNNGYILVLILAINKSYWIACVDKWGLQYGAPTI